MPALTHAEHDAIAYIRSPAAIRERCQQMLELACADRLRHFAYHPDRLPEVAGYVAAVTRDAYPDLAVPLHSRWRHFDVGGIDRVAQLDEQLGACSPAERTRCHFDLVITSVLLDAGAGEHWQYHEARSGQTYSRSEGLAVASFNAFLGGVFSSRKDYPWQADARGLQRLTETALADAFQVTADNPLVGLAGRAALLRALGRAVQGAPQYFGTDCPRLGHLFDYLCAHTQGWRVASRADLAGRAREPWAYLARTPQRGWGQPWRCLAPQPDFWHRPYALAWCPSISCHNGSPTHSSSQSVPLA